MLARLIIWISFLCLTSRGFGQLSIHAPGKILTEKVTDYDNGKPSSRETKKMYFDSKNRLVKNVFLGSA